MYDLILEPRVNKIFKKLSKKNPRRLLKVYKKIQDLRINPFHQYKSLRYDLKSYSRVHIENHFVLIFKLNHIKQCVHIFGFKHHDGAYRRK